MRCGIFIPLALRKELIEVKKRGELIYSQNFIIKYLKTQRVEGKSPEFKLAFSIRKKIGNSVQRNLIKRRLRENLRRLIIQEETGLNCIIIAKQEILSYPFEQLSNEIDKAFSKIFKHKAYKEKQLGEHIFNKTNI